MQHTEKEQNRIIREDRSAGEDWQNSIMTINMEPQYPSTHGVLRLILTRSGETVIKAVPDIGFLPTGIFHDKSHKGYFSKQTIKGD